MICIRMEYLIDVTTIIKTIWHGKTHSICSSMSDVQSKMMVIFTLKHLLCHTIPKPIQAK